MGSGIDKLPAYEHQPVLLNETLQGLQIIPNGAYVDCTFGRGGHSRAILQKLGEKGQLLAFDKDPEAVASVATSLKNDARFTLIHGAYTGLEKQVQTRNLGNRINGILLDLGVSYPQLATAARGFSFQHDGPLDMRLDNSQGMTAATWLRRATKDDIARVLHKFGDERFARRIAKAIVSRRAKTAITRTRQLAELVAVALPNKTKNKHPATRTFQAIRIFINRELDELEALLTQAMNVLAIKGRLLVISFHSLEDRLVKRFMRRQARGGDIPSAIPVTAEVFKPKLKIVGKPIRPGAVELGANPRARSAILRIAECVAL